MPHTHFRQPAEPSRPRPPGRIAPDEPTGAEILTAAPRPEQEPTTLSDALVRMAVAEDTLRAIGAGEIDAFLVSNGGPEPQVFTLSTADRLYRMFIENMRDGAATMSSSGLM